MVSKLLALEAYPSLRDLDFRILRGVELNMRHHRWVPLEDIARFARVDVETASFRLGKLDDWGLVVRRSDIGYIGYQLTIHGYDALAIRALAKKGVIEAISTTQIGVGKDADVYVGITPSGEKVAVKFNRIGGRTASRRAGYHGHVFQDKHHTSWLYVSRLIAKKEHEALVLLSPIARVPRPVAWNRHVVVMEFVEGTELAELRDTDLTREEAERILDRVLEEYLKIVRFGIVHSDMSEFNIVLTKDGDILIIDWAQYISTAHPESYELLKRDITVLLNAFRRRWGVKKEFEKVWPEFESAWKESRGEEGGN
ncbi:serine/threonine protein kinase, RIO1 family [Thermococcus kodakarensis KOD1]|uniref:non-specific serine/threonine protein kinase n=1 Tax=Thermococcus kodakarensis (strain ATCC BAA-918 / JCM 12380 / KOD1) TaxID=69014 RepID=Q5JHS7_THEKO|nr:serine/threonine-protein kinase RIO2 [Thermococcus kodakarensis]WCN28078.1 serine/threonine-protein kinase RIO2 [Thermococcus kodakarensis]WCN30375.1 serine/threonine-protein kinase RIO2 [Thermococcus kodakarensis]BAD86439.1 serine/threonine protein kinase, RIO1 family [Thermococcus kodakarensis KOD1]